MLLSGVLPLRTTKPLLSEVTRSSFPFLPFPYPILSFLSCLM